MIEGEQGRNSGIPPNETAAELNANEVIYTPITEWRRDLWNDGWLVSAAIVDGKPCYWWERLSSRYSVRFS